MLTGSLAQEKLDANERAALELAKAVDEVNRRWGSTLAKDAETGKRVLTGDDMKELIAFNDKVKKQTGVPMFDFAGLYAYCASEHYKARDARRAAERGIEDTAPDAFDS